MCKALTEEQIQANKERLIALINSIEREGFKKEVLIAKFNQKNKPNDLCFFDAPASVKYHMDCKGGLCAHTLNVYDTLVTLVKTMRLENLFSDDTLKIVALFHDISKNGMYEITVKAKKYYFPGGSKFDDLGAFDWVNEKGYAVKDYDERFLYGTHEETSIRMARYFIDLTLEEEIAIGHHMAGMDKILSYNERSDSSAIFTRNPLATLLHTADYLSTYITENSFLDGKFDTDEDVPEEVSEEPTEEVIEEITNE